MDKRDQASFEQITRETEEALGEEVLFEFALYDKELNAVLEEYQTYLSGRLGRIARIAVGDWKEEREQFARMQSALELALYAVRIKFSLSEEQTRRVERLCRIKLRP